VARQWLAGIVFAGMVGVVPALGAAASPSTQPSNLQAGPATPAAPKPSGGSDQTFTDYSLEQLLEVPIQSPAGLTAVEQRRLPVDMMQLDSWDIQTSGAQNLNHLLEIFVPNAQVIDHHTPGVDLGFRGIISDREDKYLYQVNSVTLNNRMLYGANNERDLPLMGDMNLVNVVVGPASATYGSGGISGVVDVQTYTGLTFEGLDASARQGFVDNYTAAEFRYGTRFTADSGLFVYYGIAYSPGADAPYYIGKSEPAKNGLPPNIAGDSANVPMANLGEAAFDFPWQKFHIDYSNGPFDIWARYTQDGIDTQPRRDIYTKTIPPSYTITQWTDGRSIANQQFTSAGSFNKDLSPTWNLQLLQSYDFWLARDQREGVTTNVPVRSSYENQLFSRAILTWTPAEWESLAFGTEYAHIWYHDPPQSDALDAAPAVGERYWQSDTISFLGENQWRINKQWTLFLSLRADKNTFTEWLLSPRGSLVWEATKNDTFKLIAGKSVRRADDEDLWGVWSRTGTFSPPETLENYEFVYERKLSSDLTLGVNAFYQNYNAIGWSPSQLIDAPLGHYEIAGGELTLEYRVKGTRVVFSEGISKLTHASVPPGLPIAGEGISAAPYGFGNDLAAWATSITKLSIAHDFTKKFTGSTSVIYYSGFPGAQDYANFAATLAKPPSGVPLSDPGFNTPYGPNLYWNLGLEFRPTEQLTLRVDGYNLVALFDPTLSKRNYILRESEFSVQPASVGLTVKYSF
jgi:iron complex outermembrane receptor protein